MFGEDMEGKYVSTMCGWPRQPLCLLREMAGNEAVATTNLTTLVHHISQMKTSFGEITRDLPGFFKSLLSVAPGCGVVRNQVP